MKQILKKSLAAGFDLILPPRCASCHDRIMAHGFLCAPCYSKIRLLTQPCCKRCGRPFEYHDALGDQLCGSCMIKLPPYDKARAGVHYDGQARKLVLHLKHSGGTEAALPLARLMIAPLTELLEADPDTRPILLIPVPIHPKRMLKRRYNQAQLLAKALVKHHRELYSQDLELNAFALERTRHTPSQKGLTAYGRQKNVRGSFLVPQKYKNLIKGAHIILIDDVMTTGATIEACSRQIIQAGAGRVSVLTAARVVME